MKILLKKLKEERGSMYVYTVIFVIIFFLVSSVLMEFARIKITVSEVKGAFEKSVQTVAIENNEETYAGIREEEAVGGIKEGGLEGIYISRKINNSDLPEWEEVKDYGAVIEELSDLLELNNLIKSDEYGDMKYVVYDLYQEVRTYMQSNSKKYEIKGELIVEVPFYFFGTKITETVNKVKIKTAYTEKY